MPLKRKETCIVLCCTEGVQFFISFLGTTTHRRSEATDCTNKSSTCGGKVRVASLPLSHSVTTAEVSGEAASQTSRALQYPPKELRATCQREGLELRIAGQGMESQGTWPFSSSLEDC